MTLSRREGIKGFDPHSDYVISGIDIIQILMNCKGIRGKIKLSDTGLPPEPSDLAEGIEGILAKLIKQDDQEALK